MIKFYCHARAQQLSKFFSNVTMKGGENGNDNFNVAGSNDPAQEDTPDYMINSLVDIDGGL